MNSRDEYETRHKTREIHTYIDNQEVTELLHFISEPFMELRFLQLMSALHKVLWAVIEFQRDAPAKEKLVLNRSVLDLGSILDRDGARLL